MRTRMVEEREGEYLGPVDWSYDFTQHDWHGASGGVNPAVTASATELLRKIEGGIAAGEEWWATTDGGWPRCGWKRVVQVGMYDGWPFWRPTPSLLLSGMFGGEWASWYNITEAERREPAAVRPVQEG
jgi:hypothetical protein